MVAPKLRFKEFDGYWNKNTIGNFVLNYKGGASLTPADFVDYSECEVIPKKAISSGGALQLDKDVPTFCTPEFFNLNQNYVVDSEYLITTLRDLVPSGPSIGYIVKYEGDKQYILAQGVYGFRIKNDLCRDFLIQFSNTSKFRLHMQSIMVGSTQVHIRNHDYFSTELYTPSLLEQTQIASFLSTVDEKISQLSQKLHLLGQYKQGMMQKLFSQQIRFKADDGSEFGQWQKMTLGDATTLISRRNKNDIDAEIYSVTNSQGFVKQNEYFEDRRIAGEDTSSYKIIKKNEFAYNPARINVGSIALFKDTEIGIISSLYVCFSVNESTKIEFLEYFLKLQSTIKNYGLYGEGGVRIYLWYPLFSKIPFSLPCLEEQTKIVSFLSAIDQKINVASEQLEQAKLWKKGLLQQMFV